MDRQFDTVLETLAGLAAANIVLVETLHEHGVLDKSHFAHARAQLADYLARVDFAEGGPDPELKD